MKKCNWKVSVRYPCHLFLPFLHLFLIVIVLCVVKNKIQTHKTYRPKPTASETLYNSLHHIYILPNIYLWYYLHMTFFQVFACFMYFGFVCPCFLFFYIRCFTLLPVLNTNSFSTLGWLRGTERYLSWLFRWNRVFLQNLFNTLHLDNWKQSKRSYK